MKLNTLKHSTLAKLETIPIAVRRSMLVIFLIVGGLILIKIFPNFFAKAVITIVIFVLCKALFLRIYELSPHVLQFFVDKYKLIQTSFQEHYQLSAEAEFFYALTIFVGLISVGYFVLTNNAKGFNLFNNLLILCFGLAAVFDFSTRVSKLIKKGWAKLLGKLMFTAIGALLVFISLTLAKFLVRDVTQADPQYFQDTVNLLSTIYMPFLYVLTLCLIVTFYALLEYVVIGFGLVTRMFYRQIKEAVYIAPIQTSFPNSDWRGVLWLIRPISLLFIPTILLSTISSADFFVKTWSKSLLVATSYHANTSCKNIQSKDLVAELKDGATVSVATKVGAEYYFQTKSCEAS